jgi:hypothetical protein
MRVLKKLGVFMGLAFSFSFTRGEDPKWVNVHHAQMFCDAVSAGIVENPGQIAQKVVESIGDKNTKITACFIFKTFFAGKDESLSECFGCLLKGLLKEKGLEYNNGSIYLSLVSYYKLTGDANVLPYMFDLVYFDFMLKKREEARLSRLKFVVTDMDKTGYGLYVPRDLRSTLSAHAVAE